MNEPDGSRKYSRRAVPGVIICPSCAGPLKPDSKWCPRCSFTGSRTLELFPHAPPPLLPVLDAVGLLDDAGVRRVESAREKLKKKFPQFHWRVCLVHLPEDIQLPVFGFWLLNTCPFQAKETLEDRAWTVLLLINTGSGDAAVVPGYAAEPYLSNDDWKVALEAMKQKWRERNPSEAIIDFFKSSRSQLEHAWRRYGARVQAR